MGLRQFKAKEVDYDDFCDAAGGDRLYRENGEGKTLPTPKGHNHPCQHVWENGINEANTWQCKSREIARDYLRENVDADAAEEEAIDRKIDFIYDMSTLGMELLGSAVVGP